MVEEPRTFETDALAELARCETSAQRAGWAARFSARVAEADAALLYLHDASGNLVCAGAWGEETARRLRRSAGRDSPLAREAVQGRLPILLRRGDPRAHADAVLQGFPPHAAAWAVAPLVAEKKALGLLALAFREPPPKSALEQLERFLSHATAALDSAVDSDRRTAGHLQAIERLTSLFDASKAFGSTIDLGELSAIIARKAADFTAAEVASLWTLDEDEVVLAATAVNANYDVSSPPDAVGGSLVGDLLGEPEPIRRNAIPEDDPIRTAEPDYPVRSLLAAPLVEDEKVVGALVLANKRGRVPEFSDGDVELLLDLSRQAVRALRNARQYEAQKKVEELDALLTVSREITSTLDLDKVMQSIVNSTAALIQYDRCAIAIQSRGRLRLGAVSGLLEIDRNRPDLKRTEEILEWVYGGGVDVNLTEDEDGTLMADRPETAEKFRAFFRENKLKAFYAIVLKDEEGKLGVLSFESGERLDFDPETRGLLQILVNQATVAVRNAQLYQQVPLAGFWQPLLEKKKKFLDIPKSRRAAWGVSALVLFVFLFLVPWRFRLTGAARVLPGRRAAVTSGVDGVVARVLKLEGDAVKAGEVIATLENEAYTAALAAARSASDIAEADLARFRAAGDATAAFEAESRRKESAARIVLEEERLARTRLVSPVAGVIVTPRIQERVGQSLARGAELCVVADAAIVTVEIAIEEEDSSRLAPGQSAEVKLNPYPTRTFRGTVSRVGALVREEGKERFVVAEVGLENPETVLKPGMQGKAKVRVGRSNIATLLLRRPARWLYGKLWPLLP